MSLIDDIKRDREAGTQGPWEWDKPEYWPDWDEREGYLGGVYHGDGSVILFGDNTTYYPCEGKPPSEHDARRIARVPDMEAALLAADALADLVSELLETVPDTDWDRAAHSALDAYREATK